MNRKIIIIYFAFLLFSSSKLFSQTCGFGCLGLAGVFGGYTVQKYEAQGLNNYLFSLHGNDGLTFKEGKGFRIGANIVRARYDYIFFSIKGFYQFMNEEKEIKLNHANYDRVEYFLSTDNWGVSIDFGFPVFDFLDIKLVEGGINFYNPSIRETFTLNLATVSEQKFDPKKITIGYYAGSGIILNIIPDYMSLEGTVIYSVLQFDSMNIEGSHKFAKGVGEDMVNLGGLGAIIQLNLGIPL